MKTLLNHTESYTVNYIIILLLIVLFQVSFLLIRYRLIKMLMI